MTTVGENARSLLTCNLTLNTAETCWATAADTLSSENANTLVLTVRSATELFGRVSSTTFSGDILLCRSFQSVEIGFDGRVFFVGLRSIASQCHF